MSESTRTSALSVDIDALVEYLNTASIRLAVFGEFSAGKTTVLNALIGEEILSVAVEPTTAVPTRVRYGREFNIFAERTGGDGPALFEDDPPFWTRFVGRRDTLSTLKKQQGTIRDFLRTWTKEGQRADEVERVATLRGQYEDSTDGIEAMAGQQRRLRMLEGVDASFDRRSQVD